MTGLIPQPFIDELINRTDIVELIDSYLPLKKAGNSFVANCPFHNEKTPSFNVIFKKQFYHCFGCSASGNVISFVMNYLNQSFVEAVETLALRLGLQVPREGNSEKNQHSVNLYQLLNQVSQFYEQQLKSNGQPAINYLRERGLTGEIAKHYQLGYATQGWHTLQERFKKQTKELIVTGMLIQKEQGGFYDRYRHRIIFPIHDRLGRIIGFGGRALEKDQKPKYLNSPETIIFQKSRELYGLYQIIKHNKTNDKIIVVEGYMDVIALAQYGINNAVAALGTATSIYHIQLLAKHCKALSFCFDGDAAGRQAAWKAVESSLPQLNSGLDVSFVFLPEGHDPDSLIRQEGKEAFLACLNKAIPLHRFFLETLSQGINLANPAGKSQLINASKPYLLKMQEGPYKQLLLDELARMTRIDSDRLYQISQQKESQLMNATKISRSPIRLAIALLLQHPEIFSECQEKINIDLLDSKELKLLQRLLYQVSESLNPTAAGLIEPWRDTEFFESLNKLAAWDHQVPKTALTKEFTDILLFLQNQLIDSKINQLIEKSRNQGLTSEERIDLQAMLQKRQQLRHLEINN